ncbi:polysaccharide pyruvyl transferase family protein [Archangium violaceum]|uniref:polysaccharide pyruvyl transferase family protein n=1 Tax=Archangium violaceum TaxID=83451 RepID=UPI00194FEB4B|nr:polysaccharide pyruvyl transferase family protein [Archangium violaceum]QRN95955.1 polysaccharide pyruvyl transferase family protein [Archangium violaceum]
MHSLLAALHRNALVARERLSLLREGGQRVAYAGGHGWRNLGDDALFEAAQRVLEGVHLVSFRYPRHEERFAHLGLSGRPFFQRFVLGGGTFINPYGLGTVRAALRQGLPAWTLGTGVGSAGFNMSRKPDLAEWRALLRDFQAVGVRGPRSKALLEDLGVSHAEVIGDLALVLAREAPVRPLEPRRFAVNLVLPPRQEREGFAYERLEGLERAIRHFMARKWEPLFVAMHEHDVEALYRLKVAVGRAEDLTHSPRTAEEYMELVGPCTLTFATRLHAAVLSCCAGTPTLSLGYREKCLDFMSSLGLDAWHVDLSVPEEDIFERALELAEVADGLRAPILARAQAWQRRLHDYARNLLASSSWCEPSSGEGSQVHGVRDGIRDRTGT